MICHQTARLNSDLFCVQRLISLLTWLSARKYLHAHHLKPTVINPSLTFFRRHFLFAFHRRLALCTKCLYKLLEVRPDDKFRYVIYPDFWLPTYFIAIYTLW